jgi:hypothetical protein
MVLRVRRCGTRFVLLLGSNHANREIEIDELRPGGKSHRAFSLGGIMSNSQACRDVITPGRRASVFGGAGDGLLQIRLLLTIRTMERGRAEPCVHVMECDARWENVAPGKSRGRSELGRGGTWAIGPAAVESSVADNGAR